MYFYLPYRKSNNIIALKKPFLFWKQQLSEHRRAVSGNGRRPSTGAFPTHPPTRTDVRFVHFNPHLIARIVHVVGGKKFSLKLIPKKYFFFSLSTYYYIIYLKYSLLSLSTAFWRVIITHYGIGINSKHNVMMLYLAPIYLYHFHTN